MRWACGPLCARCPARQAVGASLTRTLGFRMTFLQLLLTHSSQSVDCSKSGPQRSLTFRGTVYGEDDELKVTRDGRDFDARLSRWTISLLDELEQPRTEYYEQLTVERGMEYLAGAIYWNPAEYSEAEQPDIEVYVWLPSNAFDSIWNIAPMTGPKQLRSILNLTGPFRRSALNYAPGDPDGSDKIWNAELENPLLLERTEFRITSVKNDEVAG